MQQTIPRGVRANTCTIHMRSARRRWSRKIDSSTIQRVSVQQESGEEGIHTSAERHGGGFCVLQGEKKERSVTEEPKGDTDAQ